MPSNSASNGRVFVSSTCYDLVDLRAALEVTLKEAGLLPLLSDRPTSEFDNTGEANSIETCLGNLRACERCIVVLSQRYGPSLQGVGYDDLSATHLEYREAIKSGIPVLFYVRDRLWGEYQLWRKNKGLHPAWTRPEDATRLFEFVEEHAKLEATSKSNWVWPFSTAIDLSRRVVGDLGATAIAARIRALAEQGRLPLLSVTCGENSGIQGGSIRNSGEVAAIRVGIRQPDGFAVMEPTDLRPGESRNFKFVCGIEAFSIRGGYGPVLRVDYETATGERLCDLVAVLIKRPGAFRVVRAGRQFLGYSLGEAIPELVIDRGVALIELTAINQAHLDGTL